MEPLRQAVQYLRLYSMPVSVNNLVTHILAG